MGSHVSFFRARRRKRAWISGVLLAGVLLCAGPIAYYQVAKSAMQNKSMAVMDGIGYAVLLYENDHDGKMPQELFALVPEYLDKHELLLKQASAGWFGLVTAASSAQDADEVSSCAIAPLRQGGFVINEQPSPWKDRSIGYVCRPRQAPGVSALSACRGRVGPEEFKKLSARDFDGDHF